MQLLIAEDHAPMGEALASCLRAAGHQPTWVAHGDAALAALRAQPFDLLVLDHGLPGAGSAAVLAFARRQSARRPVLLISALDDAELRLAQHGLRVDAFLVKPFGLGEFEQRIAGLADPATLPARERLSFGQLRFEIAAGDISLSGQPLHLPPDEHALLRILLQQHGRPLGAEELTQRLAAAGRGAASVDGCVARLRDRLGAHALGIARLRGLGFCLTAL